jgi:ribonuclease Y
MTIVSIVFLAVAVAIFTGLLVRSRRLAENFEKTRESAGRMLEEAKRKAEDTVREATNEAREAAYRSRQELEREISERRKEAAALDKKLEAREDSLDRKFDVLGKRDEELSKREREALEREKRLEGWEKNLSTLESERRRKLEEASGLSTEEAKRMLLQSMEEEARLDAAKLLKRIENETAEEAEKKAKEIIALAIQRYAGDYVAEKTVTVVSIPNDEMKGRIIGREGRNIRAIEAITGVEVIIDDTPEAVIVSGHNPVRREIARQAIERLVSDGRIHPARIEEVVEKVAGEVEKGIMEAGERAIFDTGLHGVHPEIQRLIGKLKYRTSYAQSVYAHSLEVAFICGIMAGELKLPVKLARRAGLLHDIGKAVDHEVEGTHAAIGAELARKYGENPMVVEAIARHHDDQPGSLLPILVNAADALSAARPGARKEMYESYVKRLEDIERIARGFTGVEKSYALQAGREVRVVVESSRVDDSAAALLAREIAKKIEKELSYPGQIKITVIRETRAVSYAK